MTLFLVATLFAAAAADTSCDVTELLQSHTSKVIDQSNQGALQELAELLAKAKRTCKVEQSPECMPLLQDLRGRVWPYVMGELAETGANLDLQPNQIQEEHAPRADLYRAALQPELCEGEQKPLYFTDLTEASNEGMIKNLDTVSRENLRLLPSNAKASNCEELIPKDEPQLDHEAAFVLVRNPLDRFVSGYVAIEQRVEKGQGENYQFLQQSKGNLTERVTTFLDNFFRNGANHSRHVASMAEYVGNMNKYCQRLPLKYFAHVEKSKEGWIEFLHHMGCSQVMRELTAFNAVVIKGNFTRTMKDAIDEKDPPFVAADAQIWENKIGKAPEVKVQGHQVQEVKKEDNKAEEIKVTDRNIERLTKEAEAREASLLQVESSVASAARAEMSRVMGLNNYVYLRAFCWFALPDYVLFEYDLPYACHREDMNVILKLTDEHLKTIREKAQAEREKFEKLHPKEEKKPADQKQNVIDDEDEEGWDMLDEGFDKFDD